MSVFNGETHNLQTWKYDVSVMSQVAKKIYFFYRRNSSSLLNIP